MGVVNVFSKKYNGYWVQALNVAGIFVKLQKADKKLVESVLDLFGLKKRVEVLTALDVVPHLLNFFLA